MIFGSLLLLLFGLRPISAKAQITDALEKQIKQFSAARTEAEKTDDLEAFLAFYDEDAISMPEYQPLLHGLADITAYYQEIFPRQAVKTFQKEVEELFWLDSTIVELGTFIKKYEDANEQLLTQKGKYWNIWRLHPDGKLKLRGEAFGFFHPIDHPEHLTVLPDHIPLLANKDLPYELSAYNALMGNYVKIRDGELRTRFFTDDVVFMPFQEPTLRGMAELKPYLIEYSSRGNVTLDSVLVQTYDHQYAEPYVLEYYRFRVKWTSEEYNGRTEGKGIRIWTRQADNSLKKHREIGTHNHLN